MKRTIFPFDPHLEVKSEPFFLNDLMVSLATNKILEFFFFFFVVKHLKETRFQMVGEKRAAVDKLERLFFQGRYFFPACHLKPHT